MPKPKISRIRININKLGLRPRPAMFNMERQSVGFGIKIGGKYANKGFGMGKYSILDFGIRILDFKVIKKTWEKSIEEFRN